MREMQKAHEEVCCLSVSKHSQARCFNTLIWPVILSNLLLRFQRIKISNLFVFLLSNNMIWNFNTDQFKRLIWSNDCEECLLCCVLLLNMNCIACRGTI